MYMYTYMYMYLSIYIYIYIYERERERESTRVAHVCLTAAFHPYRRIRVYAVRRRLLLQCFW